MSLMLKNNKVIDEAFLLSLETLDLYIRKLMKGRFGGMRRSYGAGSSCEFLDYQEYMPGDDLRRIDWNLVARLDRYYVKRFVDERQQETHIYLDTSRSMCADATGHKALTALRMSMALAYLSVRNMDRVAWRLLCGSVCKDLCGSVTGLEGFYRCAEKLEGIAFSGAVQLDEAICADPLPGYDDGLSVIISDFMTASNWKSAVDYLLGQKREVALIQVLAPEEADPRLAGPCALMDSEAADPTDNRHMHLNINRLALRAYQQAFSSYQQDLAAFCASRGIAVLTVRTDEPVEDTLIRYGFQAGLIR